MRTRRFDQALPFVPLSRVGFFTSGSVGCGAAPCTQLYANSTARTILTKDWQNKVIDKSVQSARKGWSGKKNAALKRWNWVKKEVMDPIGDVGKKIGVGIVDVGKKIGVWSLKAIEWTFLGKKGKYHQHEDGEYTETVQPSYCTTKDGEIIFVNGILNSPDDHDESKQKIADAFGRPVRGIYNKSEGVVRDLGQAIGDMRWPLSPSLFGALSPLLFGGGGKNQATIRLYEEIRRKLEKGEEVRIVAHSQGAIILRNALREISRTFGREEMKKIKVITMGSPVPVYTFPWGPDYKHWVFAEDPIARIGAPSHEISRLDRDISWYNAPGIMPKHGVSTYLQYKDHFDLPDSWEERQYIVGGGGHAW